MDPFVYLSQPVYQSLGIALIGALTLCLHRYRSAAAFFGVSLLWLVICATPAFATWMLQRLEAGYPAMKASAYPTADAIVILGGGEIPDLSDESEDKSTADTRVGFGLELFRQAKASLVLLSGSRNEVRRMAVLLQQQGVPKTALLTENSSHDTHQNALHSAPILKHLHLRRILLVTSPLHMRRAEASFEHQGFTVIPAPTAHEVLRPKNLDPWLPRLAALRDSRRGLREYFGLWIYEMFRWA